MSPWLPRTAALLTLLCLSAPAFASSQTENGAALSEHLCARCHVVTPNPSQGWTNAPAFEAIANRPDASAASLSAYIQKPHADMLNSRRPPGEATAIAAYIMSLRKQ